MLCSPRFQQALQLDLRISRNRERIVPRLADQVITALIRFVQYLRSGQCLLHLHRLKVGLPINLAGHKLAITVQRVKNIASGFVAVVLVVCAVVRFHHRLRRGLPANNSFKPT